MTTTLENYSDRVQYSVFVIDIHLAAPLHLKGEVRKIINNREDLILFYDLGLVSHLSEAHYSYLEQERKVTGSGPLIV